MSVQINASEFSSDVFTLDIPPGYVVWDEVAEVSHVVGPNAVELTAELETFAVSVQSLLRNGPEPRVVGAVATSRLLFIVVAVLFVGWLAVVGWRRRTRGAGLIVLFVAVIGGNASAQSWLDHLTGERVFNNGVSTCSFGLRHLGFVWAPDDVARRLGCGRAWQSRVSLPAIQRVMTDAGVIVPPFDKATPGWVAEKLRGERSLRVILLESQQPAGYYYLAVAAGADSVLILDVPRGARWVSLSAEKHRKFWTRISGRGLLMVSEVAVSDLSAGGVTKLDLGTIALPVPEAIVKRSIRVCNNGRAPLSIADQPRRSSCSCFLSATLSNGKGVAPGEIADLTLEFDPSMWIVGEIRERVVLDIIVGGKVHPFTVDVGGRTERARSVLRVRAIPTAIDMGFVKPGLRHDSIRIVVLREWRVTEIRSSSERLRVREQELPVARHGQLKIPFSLDLVGVAPGDFTAEIIVRTQREGASELRVPVRCAVTGG